MRQEAWVKDVFRPLAVGGMVGCIALSMVELVHLFFPRWNGTFIVVGCVLAALEATYSYRLVRSRRLEGPEWIHFRLIEMALFLILLRVGSYVGDPWSEVLADIRTWPQEPWLVLDLEVMGAFCLVVVSWLVSTNTTYDLERIGEPPARDHYYVPPVEALSSRFFWGGALLLCSAGLARIGISNLLNLSRPSVPGLIINVLVYFALGLLMLGQIQFSRLSARWRKEGLDVPAGLSHHWIRYTLVLLGLAGAVAFMLPTAYALPLLDLAAIAIQAIFYVFNLIFYLALVLFLILLTPLAWLLGGEIRSTPPEAISPPQIPRVTPTGSAPAWLEILKSLTFWVVALGLVVYVVRSYLRDRSGLAADLTQFRIWHTVRHLFRALVHQLGGLFGAARERFPKQLRLLRRRAEAGRPLVERTPFRFFRLGALSRRERTLYYYLSILRRAARHGFPRIESQTPYEYDAHLAPNVPQVELELDRLTDAFVEVRYSQHEVQADQEERVREDWKKVRAALRLLGQQTTPDETAVGAERE